MAELVLANLSKTFLQAGKPPIHAIKEFNLTIKDSQFVVLLGPSGAGKTTLLRLIAGLEESSQGTISIDGKAINHSPPQDRDIAMVFQSFALYPHMTAGENIAFPLRLRKFPRTEIVQRVREAAEILGLSDLLERKPNTLSGGERQRVAVARALVRQPKVFLFDEPLSNLDPALRSQVRSGILRLHQQLSAIMIYVTHDQVEAMAMGNPVVMMKDGSIAQMGQARDLYENPANIFVAEFIGSPTMNFLRGTIIEKADTLLFAGSAKDGSLTLVLDKQQTVGLRAYRNSQIVLGLRPEDLAVGENTAGPNVFKGTVELVEPTGREMFLHVRVGSMKWIICAPAHCLAHRGDDVEIVASINKAHFFDAKSGRSLKIGNVTP